MKTYRIAAVAAVLLLAACGTTTEEPEPTTPAPAAVETTQEPTEEPTTPEPTTEQPEPTTPPEQCHADGHVGPIWEAINTADLPGTAMIANVEEFPPMPDAEDQNSTVVQVTVCAHPMNRDETKTVATAIAVAAEDAEGPGIYRMDVELWAPDASGELQEVRHLFVEDFGSIVWERDDPEETFNFWNRV